MRSRTPESHYGGLWMPFSAATAHAKMQGRPALRQLVTKMVYWSLSLQTSWQKLEMHSLQNHQPSDFLFSSLSQHQQAQLASSLTNRQKRSMILRLLRSSELQPVHLWRQRVRRGCSSSGKEVNWKSGSGWQAMLQSATSGYRIMHWKGSERLPTNYLARLVASSSALRLCAEGESERV